MRVDKLSIQRVVDHLRGPENAVRHKRSIFLSSRCTMEVLPSRPSLFWG